MRNKPFIREKKILVKKYPSSCCILNEDENLEIKNTRWITTYVHSPFNARVRLYKGAHEYGKYPHIKN